MEGNPIVTWVEIIALFIIVGVCIWVYALFNQYAVPALGSNTANTVSNTILTGAMNGSDSGLVLVAIIVVLLDIVAAYFKPNLAMGVANVFIIIIFGYLAMLFLGITKTIGTAFGFNSIFPSAYALITSNWFVTLVFFALVASTIMNFRSPSTGGQGIGQGGEHDAY